MDSVTDTWSVSAPEVNLSLLVAAGAVSAGAGEGKLKLKDTLEHVDEDGRENSGRLIIDEELLFLFDTKMNMLETGILELRTS